MMDTFGPELLRVVGTGLAVVAACWYGFWALVASEPVTACWAVVWGGLVVGAIWV